MSLMDIYKSIVLFINILWSALRGAVVGAVDFILNANILFLVSVVAVLACGGLFVYVYDRLMTGIKNEYGIDPYSATGGVFALINIPVIIGVVFACGYFIEYISKAFKVI